MADNLDAILETSSRKNVDAPTLRSSVGSHHSENAAQASAVIKRYKDAYVVARVTNGFGSFFKVAGVIIGALLAFGGFMVAGNAGPRDPMSVLGVVGIVVGVIAGALFFIIGVLVSAQGQMLKASLDGAVNSSPFLSNAQRAQVMSLPEA